MFAEEGATVEQAASVTIAIVEEENGRQAQPEHCCPDDNSTLRLGIDIHEQQHGLRRFMNGHMLS